jgi:hypothetical protein
VPECGREPNGLSNQLAALVHENTLIFGSAPLPSKCQIAAFAPCVVTGLTAGNG